VSHRLDQDQVGASPTGFFDDFAHQLRMLGPKAQDVDQVIEVLPDQPGGADAPVGILGDGLCGIPRLHEQVVVAALVDSVIGFQSSVKTLGVCANAKRNLKALTPSVFSIRTP